jgi:putative intracellular protease/amidase
MSTTTPLKIGLLLPSPTPIQLLDLSAIDLLYMTTATYLSSCPMLPKPLLSQSRPCTIDYISASPPGSLHACTSNLSVRTTASLSDPAVAPGQLDLLLVPGPAPGIVPGEEVLAFLRAHFEAGAHVLGICTGVFVCGYAGILEGKWVTGPRALIPMLREKFPGAEKWDESRRVVKDGRVWTCGMLPSLSNQLLILAGWLADWLTG